MRNLFLPGADLSQTALTIEGPDGHHLATVLRVRVGERITALDDRGGAVEAEISEVGKRSVGVRVIGPALLAPEPEVHITVAQALGKGDKFEQVIQHGTEVGASAFIPLTTERSVVRLDRKSGKDKRTRWQLIAKGAAEQSGRARIPAVELPCTLPELTRRFGEYNPVMMLHPEGSPLEVTSASARRLLLLVGPEGGFSPSEVSAAAGAGGRTVSLGDHILRTETAALVAVAQILFAARAGR